MFNKKEQFRTATRDEYEHIEILSECDYLVPGLTDSDATAGVGPGE
jgi:hypothetical protein